MNPNEGCKCNRTKKWFIVSKRLMIKVGRGLGFVIVDDLQVKLICSNKSAQDFITILSWLEISIIRIERFSGTPR